MFIKNLQIFSFSIALLIACSFNSIKAYAYGPFAAPVTPTAPIAPTTPMAAPVTPTAPITPTSMAVPITPTAPTAPPPTTPKVCCVCSHFADTRCNSKSYWSCGKNCEWTGGMCEPSKTFKTWCDNWFKSDETKDCTEKEHNEIQYDGMVYLGDPTGSLRNCDSVKNKYFGHGLGCEQTFKYITVCVDSDDPDDFNFDFQGCHTFQDLSAAYKYAGEVKTKLGTSQCINITADQTSVSADYEDECSRSAFNIKITKKKTCGKAGTCNFGAICIRKNEKGLCTKEDSTGSLTTTCKKCSDASLLDISGNYYWAEAPLSECQSEPSPTTAPSGNEETTNGINLDEE
jgi:hypothetical protein